MDISLISTPPINILPSFVSQNLAINLAIVLFPLPEGPTKAVNSFFLKIQFISDRTLLSKFQSYENEIFFSSIVLSFISISFSESLNTGVSSPLLTSCKAYSIALASLM